MNLDWIAALMIRMWGLVFLCNVLLYLTHLLNDLQQVNYAQLHGRDASFYLVMHSGI